MRFQTYLYIFYFLIAIFSYSYLRNSYFPQFPSKLEKFVAGVMAVFWIVSVPTTLIIKQGDNSDALDIRTSYDGFVGREQ